MTVVSCAVMLSVCCQVMYDRSIMCCSAVCCQVMYDRSIMCCSVAPCVAR